jgi:hypothetical protein
MQFEVEKASFEDTQKQLTEKFLQDARIGETDEELGSALLDLILQSERLRHGVKVSGPEQAEVDRQTLERLHSQTELGPEHAFAESMLKRLAKDPASAMRHYWQAIEQRSCKQSGRGKKNRPGGYDSITKLINDIVDSEPDISTLAVKRELGRIDGIVIADGEIRNTQDESTMKLSNLASRVSDARRRAKKIIG